MADAKLTSIAFFVNKVKKSTELIWLNQIRAHQKPWAYFMEYDINMYDVHQPFGDPGENRIYNISIHFNQYKYAPWVHQLL